MKPTYLKPRADGTVRLIVSVFTNGEMEDVPANSPYFNQAAPITTNIEISQEGLFDLDVIEKIIKQWKNTRFPPEGFTGDPRFPRCTSLLDLCAQWMQDMFT